MMNSTGLLTALHAERERRQRYRARTAWLSTVAPADFIGRTRIRTPQDEGAAAVAFDLWPAQATVLGHMARDPLLVVLKARQLGISWLACGFALWLCTTQPGKTALLFSQGQLEANELIDRIGFMYHEHQDRARLPGLVKDNTQELAWANGSTVRSLPATKRAGRSFTASLVVFDEFAFMLFGADLYAAAKPTIDDGGRFWIISSADGQGTPYHRFWQAAAAGANGFRPIFLPWQARPDRGPGWRRQKLAESFGDEATVKREYPESDVEAFTHAAGLVYDVWADGPADGNVTEAAEYVPGGGSVFWAVDDGYSGQFDPATGQFTADSHPRVFLLVQQKADGHLDVFAESYAVKTLPDQHVKSVLALGYPEPDFAAVDKSAAALRGYLHAENVYTRSGPSDVEESIKVFRGVVAPDENGWRRLRVHPRCRHLRFEMGAYRRDPASGKPIKQHDHGCDSLRYLCWTVRHG